MADSTPLEISCGIESSLDTSWLAELLTTQTKGSLSRASEDAAFSMTSRLPQSP